MNNKKDDSLNNEKFEFEKNFQEIQRKRKEDYKKWLKVQGLPTSSDEDEEKDKEKDCQNNNKDNEKNAYKMPKELEKIKKQRYQLDADIKQLRNDKHKNYTENNNLATVLKRYDENCKTVKYVKKNTEIVENIVPKRLPLEFRRIKESRQLLKNSYEEYKTLKNENYYDNKMKASSSNGHVNQNLSKDNVKLQDEDSSDDFENSQISLALQMSLDEASDGKTIFDNHKNTNT